MMKNLKLLGIDIGASKPHAYALTDEREKIHAIGIVNGQLFDFLNDNPVDVIAAEDMFGGKSGRRSAATIRLSYLRGEIEAYCRIKDIRFISFLGTHWQDPIKKALGLPRSMPADVANSYQWEKMRYQAFGNYLRPQLRRGVEITGTQPEQQDQIAAGCIALHAVRRIKADGIGKWALSVDAENSTGGAGRPL